MSVEKEIAALEAAKVALLAQRDALMLERAKSYADAFLRKLEGDGISARQGLMAFCDMAKISPPASFREGGSRPRAAHGSVPPKAPRPVVTGEVYQDPATGARWTANAKGRVVGWLQFQIDAGHPASKFKVGGDLVNNG